MRFLAAALLLAAPAFAADNATPKPAKAKKVCKKMEPPTGSRMGIKTVCRTEAEWEAERMETFKDVELRQRIDR